MSGAEVHLVPPGSIVILHGVDFGEDADGNSLAHLFTEELEKRLGHKEFALLAFTDGQSTDLEVLTDPERFPDWLVDKIVARQAVQLENHVAAPPARKPLVIPARDVTRG
jgi:hypothetical protein